MEYELKNITTKVLFYVKLVPTTNKNSNENPFFNITLNAGIKVLNIVGKTLKVWKDIIN